MAAIVAASVYSACVDPDKVLRLLRPLAGRSALTATLISRLVPLAAADHGRLREAAALRGPAAAPVGRGALTRRLLAGSLDRSVDVAATLELRGYGLDPPARADRRAMQAQLGSRSRHDRRLYLAGALVAAAAIAAKAAGADGFQAYPEIEVALGAEALALAVLLVLAGLMPLRRRGSRA
jgi:energy-coupling factor transport system permease protein